MYSLIRVRDSRTGYLIPVRDALWDLPGWKCCWDVVVVAAVAVGVILHFQEFTKISSQEKYMGGLLEAVLGLQGSRGVLEVKSSTTLEQNAKVALKFQFHEVFLRVGITKYCKLQ